MALTEADRAWYAAAGLNEYGVPAPEGCCGDVDCECAERFAATMTDAEYLAAYGVAKDGGPAGRVTLRSV